MKKNSLYIAIMVYAIAFLLTTSCNKLPKETHKGKNKMAYYFNNKKVVVTNPFYLKYLHMKSVGASKDLGIDIFGNSKKDPGIFLYLYPFTGVGEYRLVQKNIGANSDAKILSKPNGVPYITNNDYTGVVNINYYDEGKEIIAGTFKFDATDGAGGVVHITDGRFDMSIDGD